MEFKMPPVLHNAEGALRKVGFELEYGGVDLDTTSACIIELFGGKQHRESSFLQEVRGTELGTFHLKMDARSLSEGTYQEVLERFGIDPASETVVDLVESLAAIVVPYELGTPPVPITEIEKIERLREALYHKKALGTKASFILAYATHINAEIPKQDIKTTLLYLRAFLLLYPWLYEKADVAIRRRLASYIDPFPDEYVRLALHPDYKPDTKTFIEDYHRFNPDRNRALDLYPLLSCLNKEAVAALGDIGNVKPRPTFHYRLPNSLVDEADWSLALEWNQWVTIETLAAKPEKVKACCDDYLRLEANKFMGFRSKWISRTEEWVE